MAEGNGEKFKRVVRAILVLLLVVQTGAFMVIPPLSGLEIPIPEWWPPLVTAGVIFYFSKEAQ